MDDALNVTEKAPEDNSIYSADYFPFNPITGTEFNNPGVIQLNIENQDDIEKKRIQLISPIHWL